ncbi:class I SAM-dependent methyltransferase [Opitutales bacterium ASA1]|uniref:class I SAM-dependent methyltransferase n=1 Tax=Congregicoccus parvus TaxID=3081749 RepID=UPI002B2EA009|nr:class I SAM-dependent methyltransferase [Opitutales bacterium ASA1]
MPDFEQTDWYRYPDYYDIVYDCDTKQEVDFLEAVLHRHGPRIARGAQAHVLEPACGNGRLMHELAHRGHRVSGFDASEEMVAYAARRGASLPASQKRGYKVVVDRMESFRLRGPFHMAHCLFTTFKYLLTEDHARAHLERTARVLVPGGIYVIGLHLTDYSRKKTDREIWTGERDGVKVVSEVITRPPDPTTRLEWLRNRMRVRRKGVRTVEKLETNWQCRTYDAVQLEATVASVPAFEIVACYDFTHDVDSPRAFDDTQEDLVVVLRRRTARLAPKEAKSPRPTRSRSRAK